jgi:hypothetical protein
MWEAPVPIKLQIGLINKYYTTYFAVLSNPSENAIKNPATRDEQPCVKNNNGDGRVTSAILA